MCKTIKLHENWVARPLQINNNQDADLTIFKRYAIVNNLNTTLQARAHIDFSSDRKYSP